MNGPMDSRSLKKFVFSQLVHCQEPENEMSLGISELDLLSQMVEVLVSQKAADTELQGLICLSQASDR